MPQSLTEAFQGSDYTTVAHKHMYLHQSHTYTRTPPGCTRKRRRARGRSIYLLPYQASPHPSSHSIHPPGPTAALAELQGSQAVQTRPHDSQIGSGPPPAAATTHATADRLAAPAHTHNNSAPCAWPTWPCPSPNPSAGWTFGPAAAPEALAHTSPASPTTLTRPPNAVIRSLQTAIPARARDHLQRTRPPHELSFTTRPQGGTRPKSEAPGGAQKHQDGPGHPGYPRAHTAPNPTKSTYRHAPLHAGQIVQLRDHHAETVGNGDGLKGRTRCSPAKFVLVTQPHRISPQPAIAATRPRRP